MTARAEEYTGITVRTQLAKPAGHSFGGSQGLSQPNRVSQETAPATLPPHLPMVEHLLTSR